LRDSLSSQI